MAWEGQRRTVLHLLECAVFSAARQHSENVHALVALLGMRVSEAYNAEIEDLRGRDAEPACRMWRSQGVGAGARRWCGLSGFSSECLRP